MMGAICLIREFKVRPRGRFTLSILPYGLSAKTMVLSSHDISHHKGNLVKLPCRLSDIPCFARRGEAIARNWLSVPVRRRRLAAPQYVRGSISEQKRCYERSDEPVLLATHCGNRRCAGPVWHCVSDRDENSHAMLMGQADRYASIVFVSTMVLNT